MGNILKMLRLSAVAYQASFFLHAMVIIARWAESICIDMVCVEWEVRLWALCGS